MPPVLSAPLLGEQRTLLHNIRWTFFKQLLEELGPNRSCRLTYNQGDLEIMAPASCHERSTRGIDGLLFVLVEELGLEILRTGSLTCKCEDLARGAEPDCCYYIQHEALVRNQQFQPGIKK